MNEYELYHIDDSGRKIDLSDVQKELAKAAKDRSVEKITKEMEKDPEMTEDKYMATVYSQDHEEYLVNGAVLMCDMATTDVKLIRGKVYHVPSPDRTTVLNATENMKAKCCGYLYHATVKDRKVGDNISPFRCNCKREPHNDKEWAKLEEDESCMREGTCKALINLNDEWDNLPSEKSYMMFGDEERNEMIPGITMASMLFCKHGGIITPIMSGQTTLLFATNLDITWYKYNMEMVKKINKIDPKFNDLVKQFKEAYEKNKSRYIRLAKQTGIPPELIAVIHYRENSDDYMKGGFSVYLHNGEPLGQQRKKYPTGKVYYDFDEAARDAISGKSYQINQLGITYDTQDIVAMLCFLETYNGLGYYKNGYVNPYLYSGTNVYISGKYIADHVYNSTAVDNQVGCYILLDALLTK